MTTGDRLSCPRCGERIGEPRDVPPAAEEGEQVRISTECPQCDTILEIVVVAPRPGEDVEMWIEDRRDDEQ